MQLPELTAGAGVDVSLEDADSGALDQVERAAAAAAVGAQAQPPSGDGLDGVLSAAQPGQPHQQLEGRGEGPGNGRDEVVLRMPSESAALLQAAPAAGQVAEQAAAGGAAAGPTPTPAAAFPVAVQGAAPVHPTRAEPTSRHAGSAAAFAVDGSGTEEVPLSRDRTMVPDTNGGAGSAQQRMRQWQQGRPVGPFTRLGSALFPSRFGSSYSAHAAGGAAAKDAAAGAGAPIAGKEMPLEGKRPSGLRSVTSYAGRAASYLFGGSGGREGGPGLPKASSPASVIALKVCAPWCGTGWGQATAVQHSAQAVRCVSSCPSSSC